MWESPEELWRRLKLGREEYLQRLVTSARAGAAAMVMLATVDGPLAAALRTHEGS